MARPSDEFLLAWASLSGKDPIAGWQAISLQSAGPVGVQAGRRSPDDAEAILLTFPRINLPSAEKLPEGQGFSIERANADGDGQLRLALTRKSAGSAELFAAMVCDVVGALDEAASASEHEAKLLRVVLGRVSAWQEFMRKGSQTLSPEAEIGLYGELTLLRAIIDEGVPMSAVIDAWVGPLDGLRDFEIGTGAMEVKASSSTTGFPAKIASLEQLNDTARQPLFLAGVRLRQSANGQCLSELVAEMRDVTTGEAEAVRLLSERLIAAGYFDVQADRYIRRFSVIDIRAFEVMGEFPRLTPENVLPGVTTASYEIDLDKAPGPVIAVADALKQLGVI